MALWFRPDSRVIAYVFKNFSMIRNSRRKLSTEIEDINIPKPSSLNDIENDDALINKFKGSMSADINSATLLGTVIGIKFFPLQSNPDQNWALIFLRTQNAQSLSESPSTSPTINREISNSNLPFSNHSTSQKIYSTSSRVHVFNRRLVLNLRDVKLGDRLFVNGFLSYYNKLSQSSEKSDRFTSKLCALVAQKVIYMGKVPDYQHSEDILSDE